MEFLRFGSSIPGMYWGCCAADIIQFFKVDPDAPAASQETYGDNGSPSGKFFGPTYRDIFWQRLRHGTFGGSDMPNHAFFAIITEWQIKSGFGKKWLEILREAGFEFLRTVNNSVYSGPSLASLSDDARSMCDCGDPDCDEGDDDYSNNDNHIFALFRNIGNGCIRDPFTPPKAWTDLPKVKEEAWDWPNTTTFPSLAAIQHVADTEIWNKIGPAVLMDEKTAIEKVGEDKIWMGGEQFRGKTAKGYGAMTMKQRKASIAAESPKIVADPFGKSSAKRLIP